MVTVPFSLDVQHQCILFDKEIFGEVKFRKAMQVKIQIWGKPGTVISTYSHYTSIPKVIHLNITRIAPS